MTPTPISTASGRPRGSLSRDEIAATALRIAREDGLRGLTMKRLGAALAVTPMAIYRHFRNKAALIDGVLDHFVREAGATAHGVPRTPWRPWVRATFGAMHRALAATPGVMPYLGAGWRFGPAAMETLDETLGVLRSAGLGEADAVEAFTTLLAFTVGSAGLENAWRAEIEDRDDPAERRRRLTLRLASASRARHPHVVDAAPSLAALAADRGAFEGGIERVLDGISLALEKRP